MKPSSVDEDRSRPAERVADLGSTEAAELALAETTYRDVIDGEPVRQIRRSGGSDVKAVIDASNSQPSVISISRIAVGGHCIPIYPQFYLWNDPSASIAAARQANERCRPTPLISFESARSSAYQQWSYWRELPRWR